MNEIIERMAKAICEQLFGDPALVDDEDRAAARAALQSLREPDEAAVERVAQAIANVNAGEVNPNWRMWRGHAREAIIAYIDAALISHQETDDGR